MPENEFEKLLFETEDRRFGALSSSDIDTLAPMLADDLTYLHANGLAEDKGEFLRKIASGERRYLRFAATKRRVHQEGELIFVFGKDDMAVERQDGPLRHSIVYTAVSREAKPPKPRAW